MNDLERFARELCAADGHNPDQRVWPHPLAAGARGWPLDPGGQSVPQWQFYTEYVRATLSLLLSLPVRTNFRETLHDILADRSAAAEEAPAQEPEPRRDDWKKHYGLEVTR